ncbi:hypothetical protein CKO25_01960 [Thiocapsa imhoffii]|uniref:Uncharacterized protein n=1 Tax=Thiocapsa imhoffii TaxID=382777 RepID=A0A9X0WF58_9GAMM|nr:TVP38/TMEM64 family protein [Thiocapsa imhoffii]MBK1643440.1 hypothetical protein [Thiocapsa imhoffii]
MFHSDHNDLTPSDATIMATATGEVAMHPQLSGAGDAESAATKACREGGEPPLLGPRRFAARCRQLFALRRRRWVVWSVRLFGLLTLVLIGAWLWSAYGWGLATFWDWTSHAHPVPFFVLLALLPAIGFPTSPFYLLAGATFGTSVALIGSALSLAAYLMLSWWIGHTGLRPWIERRLARTSFKMPTLASPAQAIQFALLVKMAPGVPATLKTYVLCISGIRFAVYFVVSFTVSLLYAGLFILLGESMLEHDFGRLGGVLLAIGFLGALIWWVRRRLSAAGKPGLTRQS